MFQDFPEYYVTAEGKLMSAARTVRKTNGQWQQVPEKELKGSVNSEGYLTVALYGKQRKTCSLHKLIALALVPGFAAGLDVGEQSIHLRHLG